MNKRDEKKERTRLSPKGKSIKKTGKRRGRRAEWRSWHPWVCLTVGFIKHFAEVIWPPSPPGDNGGRRVIAAANLIFGVMLWAPPAPPGPPPPPALEWAWACAGIPSLDPLPRIRDLGSLLWILCLDSLSRALGSRFLCWGAFVAIPVSDPMLRCLCLDPLIFFIVSILCRLDSPTRILCLDTWRRCFA